MRIALIYCRNVRQFGEYQDTYLKWISSIINFSHFSYVLDWYLLLLLLLQFCGCVHATITIFPALLDGHFIQKKQMSRLWTRYHLFWNTAYQQKIKLLYHNNSRQEKVFDESKWKIQVIHTKVMKTIQNMCLNDTIYFELVPGSRQDIITWFLDKMWQLVVCDRQYFICKHQKHLKCYNLAMYRTNLI